MNYATLSPETRKAYIETCEGMIKEGADYCEKCKCYTCPAYRTGCTETKGGSFADNRALPAIRAYFERTLKELRAMETKMTKEEAKALLVINKEAIRQHTKSIETLTKELPELQAIIDAPEVDPRVGKLFVYCKGKVSIVFSLVKIDCDKFRSHTGFYDKYFCRPVTREEALAMVYEPEVVKGCNNCDKICDGRPEGPCSGYKRN